MKRFIYKTFFFIIPFSLLYIISMMFYSWNENPDLLRLGFIPNIYPNYNKNFVLNEDEKFENLSSHNNNNNNNYKILTIGDSFSEQYGYGYKNFLAKEGFSVLHVDRFISKNQIQTLINLTNGDFFDSISVKYVVLQNVERNIIKNIQNIKLNDKLMISGIDSLIQKHKTPKNSFEYQLFSRTTLTFPLYHFPKFIFSKNYLSNYQVYNSELNNTFLFSNNSTKLLYYNDDIANIEMNNSKKNIDSLNKILNAISIKLNQKNIKLIVLPSPDKYDFYYKFINDKRNYPKPNFFELMKVVKKEYLYIDSKAILSSKMHSTSDIYFYDDTHWSPIGAKLIANSIKEILKL